MSQEAKIERNGSSTSLNGIRKYKIGKVKQTPTVQINSKTGESYIQLKARSDEKVYGCTKFLNHYKEEKKLGQGTFGEVYKGIHLETQRQVAMKKIIINMEKDLFPITAQREITIIKKLSHRNVVKLLEMVYDFPPSTNQHAHIASQEDPTIPKPTKSFYMILPYMVADLSGVLHNPRMTLQMADIKNMMLQILEGLNYIHCCKFMHRDIKTANILIDHNGVLKIADFGLARLYYGSPPNLKYPGGAGTGAKYTSVVVTRWYRAPELVLGDKHYTTAVDIWGVGCVFAEFFEKKPILQGSSDIDQGHVIFKLLGTPSGEDWEMAKYLPGKELLFTKYKSTLKERFGKYLNDTGLHFLEKLLALDPMKRYTTMSAKLDPFFTEDPLPSEKLILPCEESHEADIKRYKEEMHQAMSQRAPTAPQGHRFESGTNGPINEATKPLPATPVKKIPPAAPAAKKLKPLPGAPVAPVSDSYQRYSSKTMPHKTSYNSYNRNQARNGDYMPKAPSRYNKTAPEANVPTGPSTKTKYPNDQLRPVQNSYQPHSNRYQQISDYGNGNYNGQNNYYNQQSVNQRIEPNTNSGYSKSQSYSRYNNSSESATIGKTGVDSSRAYIHNNSIPRKPSHPSRYQPNKPVRNTDSSSLFDRITANPTEQIEKKEEVPYQQRSYSFNSTKRPQISKEGKHPKKKQDDDTDSSEPNLADLY
ncbi:serine/threonine protein kinase, CMGC, CDC2/CDK sub [Monosporozyma unispora]|nr:serine/threonine protein kinase, CMGC, CDC2/CDK sub [Kazachstania unispora]